MEKQDKNYKTREDLVKENKDLKSEVKKTNIEIGKMNKDFEELKKMMQEVISTKNTPVKTTPIAEIKKETIFGKVIEDKEYDEISPTKRIKVISLTDGTLNLATGSPGSGSLTYKFLRFGETKSITYSDLDKIITYNNHFAQRGAFYICSDDVVAIHGLAEAYKNILDLEGMKNFLKRSDDDIREIFSKITPHQQEVIVNLILEKLNKKEDVDQNKVYVISKLYGIDIMSKVYKEDVE